LLSFAAIFVWSVVNPRDLFTWFLEVLPAIIGIGIVVATYDRFRLSTLLYVLIWIHAVVLVIGGHYTYADMPLFNWIRDTFHLDRNYYDRLGHFVQGFVPAIVAREVLLRVTLIQQGKMLFFIILCICLAISAFYEFIEWWVAALTGSGADAFLGTQGDVWDTQWDMFLAFCGAILAQITLGKYHDGQLRKLFSGQVLRSRLD
jgi:putative membrane protein